MAIINLNILHILKFFHSAMSEIRNNSFHLDSEYIKIIDRLKEESTTLIPHSVHSRKNSI